MFTLSTIHLVYHIYLDFVAPMTWTKGHRCLFFILFVENCRRDSQPWSIHPPVAINWEGNQQETSGQAPSSWSASLPLRSQSCAMLSLNLWLTHTKVVPPTIEIIHFFLMGPLHLFIFFSSLVGSILQKLDLMFQRLTYTGQILFCTKIVIHSVLRPISVFVTFWRVPRAHTFNIHDSSGGSLYCGHGFN